MNEGQMSERVAVAYDLIDKVVNDGDMREVARSHAAEALEDLTRYIAELEAAIIELTWAAEYGGHEAHIIGFDDWAIEQMRLQEQRLARRRAAIETGKRLMPPAPEAQP